MARYIDALTDTGFKLIFGKENQSEEILIGFLNDLFEGQKGYEPITQITYANNERVRDHLKSKTIIHDVICQTVNGHKFILEMQKARKDDFLYRSAYYTYRGVTDQIKISSETGHLKFRYIPVTSVFICDFSVRGLENKLVSHFRFMDTDTGFYLDEAVRSSYIQLSFFNKSYEECESDFDKWIYLLKNMYRLEEFPRISRKDEVFARLERVANYSALTEEERIAYEADLRWASEYEEGLNTARREAIEEGRAEGIAKGRAEGIAKGRAEGRAQGMAEGRAEGEAKGRTEEKYEIARTAINMGMKIADIVKLTGLTEEELKKI